VLGNNVNLTYNAINAGQFGPAVKLLAKLSFFSMATAAAMAFCRSQRLQR
jgi:hypothetical protein